MLGEKTVGSLWGGKGLETVNHLGADHHKKFGRRGGVLKRWGRGFEPSLPIGGKEWVKKSSAGCAELRETHRILHKRGKGRKNLFNEKKKGTYFCDGGMPFALKKVWVGTEEGLLRLGIKGKRPSLNREGEFEK